jgi:hypothetical protein
LGRDHLAPPPFDPATLPTAPQWGFMVLFVILLVVEAALLGYLVRVFAQSR